MKSYLASFKIWGIVFLLLMGELPIKAQRQKVTSYFTANLPYSIHGNYNYEYITEENGDEHLDGPFSMIGSVDISVPDYKYWYTASAKGKYNLTGSHKHGNLHGGMILNANLNVSATNGEKATYKYNLKANYKDGIPDGNFVVNYKGENEENLNVTYKEGVLVGSYYAYGYNSTNFVFEVKGTLNSNGELIGKWLIDKQSREFINGVEVSNLIGGLDSLARLYAEGKISEKELQEQNIYVLTDYINLGYRASEIIMSDIIQYDKLGNCYFEKSQNVKYKYLKYLPSLNETGFELFKSDLISNSIEGHYIYNHNALSDYNGYVDYDSHLNLYYILLSKEYKYSTYCKGYPNWKDGLVKIYLSDKQINELKEAMSDLQNKTALNSSYLDEQIKQAYNQIIIAIAHNIDNISDFSVFLNNEIYENLKKELISIGKQKGNETLSNIYDSYLLHGEICPLDNNKDIFKLINNRTGEFKYIKKDFYRELLLINNNDLTDHKDSIGINELNNKLINLKESFETKLVNTIEEHMNLKYKSEAQKLTTHFLEKNQNKLDFFLNKKKPFDILYSTESDLFFDSTGYSEYWRSEFTKPLKAILPIVEYKITDVIVINEHTFNVHCSLITYNKKGNIKRDVIFVFNNGKICIESLLKACNTIGTIVS